jgi:hypothetical protein
LRHPRVRLDLVGCSLGRFWASTALTRHVLEQCSAHGQRCSSRESLGDNASYTLCIEIRIEIRIEIPIETPRKGFVSLPVLLSQHSQRKKERKKEAFASYSNFKPNIGGTSHQYCIGGNYTPRYQLITSTV